MRKSLVDIDERGDTKNLTRNGSKSLEEYHKDMEVALIRANMLESNEAIMAHFLHELNKDIQDIVELYHFATMEDLRRLTSRKTYPNGPNNLRGKDKEKARPSKDKSPKKGNFIP
ncbi:hypothetical protein CR513_05797, partial [Mucuna pruriens]